MSSGRMRKISNWYFEYNKLAHHLDEIERLHTQIKGAEVTHGHNYCQECSIDFPYIAVEWPCATRLIVDEAFK